LADALHEADLDVAVALLSAPDGDNTFAFLHQTFAEYLTAAKVASERPSPRIQVRLRMMGSHDLRIFAESREDAHPDAGQEEAAGKGVTDQVRPGAIRLIQVKEVPSSFAEAAARPVTAALPGSS